MGANCGHNVNANFIAALSGIGDAGGGYGGDIMAYLVGFQPRFVDGFEEPFCDVVHKDMCILLVNVSDLCIIVS